VDELEEKIKANKNHPRVFAGFSFHGVGTSAVVVFSVCKTADECIRAGGIYILGGPTEHPWQFDRLFK
jgi:hypothetical protein